MAAFRSGVPRVSPSRPTPISASSGTSRLSVTRLLERKAFSRSASSFFRTPSGFTSSRWAYRFSRLPQSPRSFAAVFSPIPRTPGTLSDWSPVRER